MRHVVRIAYVHRVYSNQLVHGNVLGSRGRCPSVPSVSDSARKAAFDSAHHTACKHFSYQVDTTSTRHGLEWKCYVFSLMASGPWGLEDFTLRLELDRFCVFKVRAIRRVHIQTAFTPDGMACKDTRECRCILESGKLNRKLRMQSQQKANKEQLFVTENSDDIAASVSGPMSSRHGGPYVD